MYSGVGRHVGLFVLSGSCDSSTRGSGAGPDLILGIEHTSSWTGKLRTEVRLNQGKNLVG